VGVTDLTCAGALELQQLHADGRLDAMRLARLDAHLASCAACRHDLALLDAICAASTAEAPILEPPDLTARILGRVAAYEERRARQTTFGLSWADGLRAGVLASTTTLLFILLSPALRPAVGTQINQAFPNLVALLLAPGPGSIAWLAWLVWIAAGVMLTLWFAGREVRAAWRRSLAQRLPSLPQLRQLW
jgi:anti-sigma factor RsiW